MFQKKQIIYSESQGVCLVDNIVSLSAAKGGKQIPYYVLKPMAEPEKVSYIPVENHQVRLREIFSIEEAMELKQTEAWRKDEKLKAAIEYVLREQEEENE